MMINLDDIVTNRRERSIYESFHTHGENASRNALMPGHYYSLTAPIEGFKRDWIPNSEEEWKEDPDMFITKDPYVDLNPTGLIFYHDKWSDTALMLNIKIIPPKYRAALIMAHVNLIKTDLDRIGAFDVDDEGNSEIVHMSNRREMNLSLYKITPSILEQYSGINIRSAIRAYKLDKITGATLMDWNNIGELPLANIETRGLIFAPSILEISSIFNKFENKQLI